MALLLLAVGVGQLRYRAWARVGSLIWSVVALLVAIGSSVFMVAAVGPAMGDMFMPGALAVGIIVGGFPYPVVQLFYFRGATAKATMVWRGI